MNIELILLHCIIYLGINNLNFIQVFANPYYFSAYMVCNIERLITLVICY
jgi:hypothetical protein